MGFMCVTTGYAIAKHSDILSCLKLLCKKITHRETGKVFERRDIEKMVDSEKFDEDIFEDVHNSEDDLMANFDLELYDDIDISDEGEFVYTENRLIRIGDPNTCWYMIYISSVESDTKPEFLYDHDIQDLIDWKKKLVQEGRLDAHVRFASLQNCCS
jgi:hypothetical protein